MSQVRRPEDAMGWIYETESAIFFWSEWGRTEFVLSPVSCEDRIQTCRPEKAFY